ncbi:MAG: hypothetical protein RBQ66_08935 [Candidatus Cloacimonadaceae bacterium]|jgi:hypothetical protein|nr:hypothetical protein [Candidatus Cloacimonadaceae bacterium]
MSKATKDIIAAVALVIAILQLLSGCKPNQLITEKIITEIDSTAVWNLEKELYKKELQITLLETDLKRTKDENINLRNEVLKHEVHYDTTAPVDTSTGRPPVSAEIITISKSRMEKTIKEYETLIQQTSTQNETLTTENANLQLTVKTLVNENKELKEKTTSTGSTKFRLFFSGLMAGILLSLLICFAIRKLK